MKQFIIITICILLCTSVFAQTDTLIIINDRDTTYWRNSFSAGANFNQTSFSSNWKAGGQNSLALGMFLNTKFNYLKDKASFDNDIQLLYGFLRNAGQDFRKNQDLMYLDSKYGYGLNDHWNAFVSANFISQFASGYKYAENNASQDVLISNFMAPAFLTFALGVEYKPEPWFSLRLSPFAPRFTFLFDEAVGINERYGVPVGSNSRTELLAALLQADFDREIFPNFNLKFTYQGFANYETLSFRTIDHRLNAIISATVNRFISMNLTCLMIYDLDQDDKAQFSQGLGLGLVYNVQNYKD
ncbi:MAG: DUF3078 domain-containing protein [Bacteroidota bacterium]|nr:DUF3078 domain-containing protein [Bacteroidota bacterium]